MSNDSDYPSEADELDSQWESEREYDHFCHDGIIGDYDEYFERNDRVLFLLKETYGGFTNIRGGEFYSTTKGGGPSFWKTMGMLSYIIDKLRDNEEPSYNGFLNEYHWEGGYPLECAYVNIKKNDTNSSESNWSDLKSYARRDQDWINQQIDLCQPNVIICCGTYQLYSHICDGDLPQGGQTEPVWDSTNERIVIDWSHLSSRTAHESNFDRFKECCEETLDWFENLE